MVEHADPARSNGVTILDARVELDKMTVTITQPVKSPSMLCSVFVASCDAYADLWKPFFTLFWQYWPDCPFPVYLGANNLRHDDARVTTIPSARGLSWADQAREQIGALGTPYVLVVLEDYFWRKPTPTKEVLTLFERLRALDGMMLRLTNRPRPDEPVAGNPSFGRIRPGAPYRISTQAAIWRKDLLLELIQPGESIWQFEEAASRRSDRLVDGFYSTWHQVLPYGYHVVQQGRWFRHEAQRFGRMNIGCDLTARPVMTQSEAYKTRVEWVKSWLLLRLPWPTRLRLLAIAKQLGI